MSTIISLIIIHCLAHTGYRRAGLVLCNGENEYPAADITDAQLQTLKADPRLKVSTKEQQLPAREIDAGKALQNQTPLDDVVLGLTFAQAVAKLDPHNKDHFTSSGKPQCDALGELMQKPVSAAERDAMWQDYQTQATAEADAPEQTAEQAAEQGAESEQELAQEQEDAQ
ncbi:hypothetical protein G3R49_12445 [Shewanella sp. WXL01]|uniref:HI1506-related protein n=1 Tax=Shewanella sp. WXL01 TaxID=2709721 RepID=UPI0014385954|nr:HI1506-related protein [Shewanella sp. WXL01]NKF51367.1 hypothetical protein [Shewanella sp. WXL01]